MVTAYNSVFAVRTFGAHANVSLMLGTSQTRNTLGTMLCQENKISIKY